MGMFDTFFDGANEEQVKCFHRMLDTYYVGDAVPYKRFRYPKDFIIYCDENTYIVIEDGIFIKITARENLPKFPIIDRFGQLTSKEYCD